MNDANDARYKFEQITEAYKVLSNVTAKAKYDQKQEFAKAAWSGLKTRNNIRYKFRCQE